MKRYAMAREGTMFVQDKIDLSWPAGGVREVIELDPEAQSLQFRQRLMNGVIAEVGLEANKPALEESPYRIYEGVEARQVLEEDAAPVVVQKHGRHSKTVTAVTLPQPSVTEVLVTEAPKPKPVRAPGYQTTTETVAVGKVSRRRVGS